MPFVPRTATVCYSKTGTLQVRRRQANMQKVSHPLLSPSDEGTNVRSDALGWSENDFVSPGCSHQAYHKRTSFQDDWSVARTIRQGCAVKTTKRQ